MKTSFSKYELIKKSDGKFQRGSLIRLTDPDGHWGVADVCPWPDLGDLDLSTEILSRGPLYQRALQLAQVDLTARKEQRQLLSTLPVETNFLVTEYKNFFPSLGTVKIKGTAQTEDLLHFINTLESNRIRLDFNSQLTAKQFTQLIPKLPRNLEYIEDPTPWNSDWWTTWNQLVPLAFDFAKADPFQFLKAWTYLIIKPSRQNAEILIQNCQANNKKFTLTSAMDHPVGFAHGLRYAQMQTEGVNGFSTLDLYESTDFHLYFQKEKSQIAMKKNNDYGIGMTAALENLLWAPA